MSPGRVRAVVGAALLVAANGFTSTPQRKCLHPSAAALARRRTRNVARAFSPADFDLHGASAAASAATDAAASVWAALPTLSLADLPVDGAAVDAAATAATAATDVAADAGGGGPIDIVVGFIEDLLKTAHTGLLDAGVPGAFGIAIVLVTCLIKLVTFPLTYQQIESTTKMQAIQPQLKGIQARYANDPQTMNQMMQQLYSDNEVNPLAGCLPAIAQIPIFIGLYRSLLNLAKEDLLDEPFLFLPSLEGPTFGKQSADWLLKFDDWNGFVPPLGWEATAAYLTIPVVLVISQKISSKLMQPPVDPNNEQAATTNAILQYLPFLVGFFSLSVPSGLSIYWFLNNVITTGTTLLIRNQVEAAAAKNPKPAGDYGAPLAEPSKKMKAAQASTFADLMDAKTPTPVKAVPAPAPAATPAPAAATLQSVQEAAGVVDVDAAPAAAQVLESKTAAKKKEAAKNKALRKKKKK